jgi:hypothetical protein
MVSEKQFRERTKVELREIGKQVAGLAADRDIYRKMEAEVIAKNPRLQNSRSAFLDTVRAAYTDAMAIRVLRLTDDDHRRGLSLPRVLAHIGEHPQLLHDKVGDRQFADDCAELQRSGERVNEVWDPHCSHPTPSALAATHRALDEALDLMISTVKNYYWVVAEGHLDLEPNYEEDPLEIFRFAWIEK